MKTTTTELTIDKINWIREYAQAILPSKIHESWIEYVLTQLNAETCERLDNHISILDTYVDGDRTCVIYEYPHGDEIVDAIIIEIAETVIGRMAAYFPSPGYVTGGAK